MKYFSIFVMALMFSAATSTHANGDDYKNCISVCMKELKDKEKCQSFCKDYVKK
jgi:hypothetical protein